MKLASFLSVIFLLAACPPFYVGAAASSSDVADEPACEESAALQELRASLAAEKGNPARDIARMKELKG